ncbi:carotenoid biosynthesis protein [Ignavibacterium sp.]|uniref:carotenoid biosynthesis protein n=1 Tax=Ignavibacterium sp. TaxID=2651167 RepID=UPI00307ED215
MERTKNLKLSKEEIFLYLIYTVGVIGHLTTSLIIYMKLLTPLTLLLTGGLVLLTTIQSSKGNFIIWAVVTYIITFSLEVIGVKTGVIFGSYWYGDTLGLKFLEVPLIIGFNWIMVILGVILLSKKIFNNKILLTISAALLATLFDFFLEPTAIKLNYWNWSDVMVPLQNYIAWFFISLLFTILYFIMKIKIKSDLPIKFFLTQLLFFIILYVFMS